MSMHELFEVPPADDETADRLDDQFAAMMQRVHAVREQSATLSDQERRKLATDTIVDLMKAFGDREDGWDEEM